VIPRLARATGALVTLVALIGGVPLVLARFGHWPIDGVPTWGQLRDLPATVVSDSAVFGVLTVAAWAVWALFVASVVVETIAELRGTAAARIPLAGPLQRHARRLVAAVLMTASVVGSSPRQALAQPLLATTVSGDIPVPAQVMDLELPHRPRYEPPPISPPAAPDAPQRPVPLPEIDVRRGDNAWELAQRHLGDPMRWREIWDLNRGRTQPDGRAWVTADLIEPGWRLQLPAGASNLPQPGDLNAATYTVRPGDSLSEIAAVQLGDEARFPELYDINRGRPQPDGDSLQHPDLIRPGWQLLLPQAPQSPPPATPAQADTPPPEEPSGPPPTPADADSTVPGDHDLPPASMDDPTVPTPPSVAAPTSASQDEVGDRGPTSDEEDPVAPIGLIGGGVATAGVLLVLERRRRARQRHRPRGELVRVPPAPLQQAERELRAGAHVSAARLVDAGLRAAAAGAGSTGLPDLAWVEASDDRVTLVLTEPAQPPPGFTVDGPRRWQSAAALDDLERLGASAVSPAPALCPVGTTHDGTEVLIDLEAAAITALTGDPARSSDLLRAMAVGAAGAPWADHARVVLVGLAGDVASIPGLETMDTLREALDAAVARADAATVALASLRCRTTGQARAVGATPDAWDPLVVISAAPPTELDAPLLTSLADRPRNAVAVVCPSSPHASPGRLIEVDEEGWLRDAGLDVAVRARRFYDSDAAVVSQLLQLAVDPHAQVGEEFAPPPVRTPAVPVAPPASAGHADETPSRMDILLGEVDVLVRVLGDVEIVRRGAHGSEQPITVSRQKALEAICYLALRESSVDREDLQAALWPSGANSAKTVSNAIWEARRRVLGFGRDSTELFPDASDGRYTLSERVLTDYGVFCELVDAAEELEDAEQAADLLTQALKLVRGAPFTGVGLGYAWVSAHRGMIEAQILNAAEELAEIRLATGDWRSAEWAARKGKRALRCDERMHRLLMRAAYAAGNIPGVQRAFRELCDELADPDSGAEPEDTVHPDTVVLLEELTAARSPRRVTA
jgi:DNA-binding SARP family transcriptional activator